MIDGKIYQGEPFNMKIALFDDDGVLQLKASDYEVDVLLRKDSSVIKSWSNHGSKYNELESDVLVSLQDGLEYQAEVSAEETRGYGSGNYSLELRVSDNDKPSISVEKNILKVEKSFIKDMSL
jgi:hypothetical protein